MRRQDLSRCALAALLLVSVVAAAAAEACSVPDLNESGKQCTDRCPSGLPCVNGACATDSFSIIRIASGWTTPVIDNAGNTWSADTNYDGGILDVDDDASVMGATTAALYKGQHYGVTNGTTASFDYTFDGLPAGAYVVALKFTENCIYCIPEGGGERIFDVSINGETVLSNFDIFNESNMKLWVAVDKQFPVTLASSGSIHIVFAALFGDGGALGAPKVDAIEVDRAAASDADAGLAAD